MEKGRGECASERGGWLSKETWDKETHNDDQRAHCDFKEQLFILKIAYVEHREALFFILCS